MIGGKKKTEVEKAEERATKLLLRHLSLEQANEWRAAENFRVLGSDGKGYWVGPHFFKCCTENPRRGIHSCVTPKQATPRADAALAIKLAVESDIEAFMDHLWGRRWREIRY